jgi:hypothetical protein
LIEAAQSAAGDIAFVPGFAFVLTVPGRFGDWSSLP